MVAQVGDVQDKSLENHNENNTASAVNNDNTIAQIENIPAPSTSKQANEIQKRLKRIVEANADNESEEDASPAKRAKVNIISMNSGVLEFEVCACLEIANEVLLFKGLQSCWLGLF